MIYGIHIGESVLVLKALVRSDSLLKIVRCSVMRARDQMKMVPECIIEDTSIKTYHETND